jgi:hypothetical protein
MSHRASELSITWRRAASFGAAAALVLFFPVKSFGQTGSFSPAAAAAVQSPGGDAAGGGAVPTYPGHGPEGGEKLEGDLGSFRFRLYGTVLLNAHVADAGILGQEVPLWSVGATGNVTYPDGSVGHLGDNHDFVLTARQSVFGFTVNRVQTSGWSSGGLIEMDFFGPRPVDGTEPQNRSLGQPRLRLAFFQLEHNGVKFVFGQDKAILAPIDPISLSHVAVPLGATAGDLWAWLPQARVDVTHNLGGTGLLFQFGILRPTFGDGRLEAVPTVGTSFDGLSSGLGERTTMPFYQARVAVMPKILGHTSTFGLSGHYGKEKVGVDRDLNSWAVAFDGRAPIGSYIALRGEAFTGTNLIPFQGGIDQGVAVQAAPVATNPPLRIQTIDDRGGWGEVTVLPTSKDTIYVGASTDKPDRNTLLPGSTRVENTMIWASYFRRLTGPVTLAVEWSNWRFKTVTFTGAAITATNPVAVVNVVNIAVAYQF